MNNPHRMCEEAVERLSGLEGFQLKRVSSWYFTEPVGYREQAWFVNGVAEGSTLLAPLQLLENLQKIESEMGRVRDFKWGPRTVDLDILFYGDEIVELPGLTIPHPELHRRRFVLVPLCELVPELRHPVLGITVKELLTGISEEGQEVRKVEYL
ncbi:2-amino-4-hydroxy-6-hydroxymethyldihydropteridinediphosphokinase [Thermodesulforhabdus norvegica]|uniref:2-amino-4-hydroxy-6-hydroxymethyldihydropteridine pyrophosphokinase n=2 Tax=Thermodesulforhabdus norvegica TaxID=39841 RepID=A0A1I4W5T7_9BACT|nr:2-amino-4-hydroxy-6-hydroxymethyldihydropteridinediphosphokinase [Thermodesulforhabdus norvegica]